MSLRTRLTLIYGLLLALVFIGLGLGAEIVMQGRFSDQAKTSLTSAAAQVFNKASVSGIHNNRPCTAPSETECVARYQLPSAVEPFAGVYLELISPDGTAYDRSANLKPSHLPFDAAAFTRAMNQRLTTFEQKTWQGNLLEIYYTPMPVGLTVFHFEPDVLVVAKSESDVSHALDVFSAALFSGEAFIWLLALMVTWMVSGSALRPITSITERAAAIADTSDFAGRVPVDTRTAELQTLAVTFNRMLGSLAEAYGTQQQFLADASHELRTPLTVLQGNLHYLEEATDAPPSEREEALHAARLEADRMGMLVGDLLALSHVDAGFGIHRQLVELDRVIVDGFKQIQARERIVRAGQSPQLRLGRLEEVVVDGDPDKLVQLVVILLDNAVKYTPEEGSVEVELVMSGDNATLCVTDTGPGIADEDREHVFERFYRSRSTGKRSDGSGLGLAIAKWIAEAHGGTIEFEVPESGGTRFVVTLPAHSPAKHAG